MSVDLVANFKTGHQSIVNILEDVQMSARSYAQAKPKIRAMNELTLVHLGRQNDELFDQLRFFYRLDREKTKMVEFLAHDLKDAKIRYLIFSEKHSGELRDLGTPDFPKNFNEFLKEILARIKIEEDYLLPLLKELPSQPENA